MKRHQDLQVLQFNSQFKTASGKEELEVVDRFPHTQQFFFDRKQRVEEEKKKVVDSKQGQPQTSLFEKIASQVQTATASFISSGCGGSNSPRPVNPAESTDFMKMTVSDIPTTTTQYIKV